MRHRARDACNAGSRAAARAAPGSHLTAFSPTHARVTCCVRTGSGRGGSTNHISRLSLSAQPTCHGAAWHAHVLPRLYAFAELVHALRESRERRYGYLLGGRRKRLAILLALSSRGKSVRIQLACVFHQFATCSAVYT